MVADVVEAKMGHHMAAYVHPLWRTHMHQCASVSWVCARTYASVCAHVCTCAISEIKHPFQDFC